MANGDKITYFAETDYRNKKTRFGIKGKDRLRHVYVIGKTGTGKSTLLENMAIQDIQDGNGIAFVDPHGKSAELLLDYVSENRINDVLYFAPFDLDNPISFNVMEDVGMDKRHLVANGLMSAFKKIWIDSWSARMEYILNNILLALLEYPEATLLGVNRMLADKEYRKIVVDNVTDVSVKAFWQDEFAKYGERYMQEAGAAIQNKVGQFISNPLIRNIIGQPHSSFDFRDIMDNKKIVIINLSKGRVGEANASLLGGMLITKIYLSSMSRADVSEEGLKKLPNFYLYVDEFQSFANESFADILSEARKYKLNLTIAHQYIEQMVDEVKAAVFGNIGTMIVFRIGANDAKELEKEFAPQFIPEDLVNLGFAQVYLKLLIDGIGSPPFSARTLPPIEAPEVSFKERIIESSRKKFGRPRAEVESYIIDWHTNTYKVNKRDDSASSFKQEIKPNKNNNFSKNKENFNSEKNKNFGNNFKQNNYKNNQYSNRQENQQTSQQTSQQTTNQQTSQPILQRPNQQIDEQKNRRNRTYQNNTFHKPFKTQNNEEEFRKAISLNYLKPVDDTKKPIERKKKMSEENVFALREALSEILSETKKNGETSTLISSNGGKNTQNTNTDTKKTEEDTKIASKTEPSPDKIIDDEGEKQKEIPEEVLRNILVVEDEKLDSKEHKEDKK